MEVSISAMINELFVNLHYLDKSKDLFFGLTPSQVRIMRFIDARQQAGMKTFQKDVEREYNLKGSSVTSILNNLEKNNWIIRENVDYDARLKSIVFSESAVLVVDQIRSIAKKFDDCLRENLSEAEFIVFCQCSEKIINTINENRESLRNDFYKNKDFLIDEFNKTDKKTEDIK